MSAFEHVTALLSFVYALALTHLLARIAELIVARDRVKFSGLLALGMVNAILLVFVNWLALWDLRSVTTWDIASIAIQFLFAVSVYIVCALVGPKVPDEGVLDLGDFFWRQRFYFYGAIIVCLVLALLANLDFLKTANTTLLVKENLGTIAILVPSTLGLVSRNRQVQWVAGVCFLVLIVGFAIMFSGTLS
jgi:phage shock protein PspC (stress-responsive transcriptional regulator)